MVKHNSPSSLIIPYISAIVKDNMDNIYLFNIVDSEVDIECKVCYNKGMKCKICGRDNLTEKELQIHTKYFHKEPSIASEQPQKIATGVCPECGTTMWFQEGCASCHSCGFSKCG